MQNRMRVNKKLLTTINYVSVVFFIVGVGGFLSSAVCTFVAMSGNPRVTTWARFPLGDLGSLGVDSKGNLYCGSIFYCRIQVYSPQGEFIRGWFLNSGGGTFQIEIDKEEKLHVHTARGNKYFIFSKEGKLLHKEIPWSGEISSLGSFFKNDYTGNDGNTYTIRHHWYLPIVVKTNAKGKDSVIVSDPFFLWLLNGPFPVFFWIVLAVILRAVKYKISGKLWGS